MERIDRQELTWQQTTALIDGLMDDHTSHTYASACGWSYVPSAEEVFFYNEVDVKAMMNRGKNQPVPQPVKRPWVQPRARNVVPRNDAETLQRRAKLAERLGLSAADGQ